MRTTTITTRRSAKLVALAATALLAAGCGASGAGGDTEESGSSGTGPDVSQSDGGSDDAGTDDDGSGGGSGEVGSDDDGSGGSTDDGSGGSDDGDDDGTGGSDDGDGSDEGDDGGGGDEGDDGGGDGGDAEFVLPDSWAGTVSAEGFDAGEGFHFFAQQHLYDHGEVTEMGALDIQGQEYFGSTDARCSGTAVLDGEAATCVYTGTEYDGQGEGKQLDVTVRLVPGAFGSSSLIYSVGYDVDTGFAVPAGVPIVLEPIAGQDASSVVQDDLERGAINAIMMSDQADGDIPGDPEADCEILDQGEHAVCTVTGTPDGAADGTWYATAQGPSVKQSDSIDYLFSMLPEE